MLSCQLPASLVQIRCQLRWCSSDQVLGAAQLCSRQQHMDVKPGNVDYGQVKAVDHVNSKKHNLSHCFMSVQRAKDLQVSCHITMYSRMSA
jgi:hypothetical protein